MSKLQSALLKEVNDTIKGELQYIFDQDSIDVASVSYWSLGPNKKFGLAIFVHDETADNKSKTKCHYKLSVNPWKGKYSLNLTIDGQEQSYFALEDKDEIVQAIKVVCNACQQEKESKRKKPERTRLRPGQAE